MRAVTVTMLACTYPVMRLFIDTAAKGKAALASFSSLQAFVKNTVGDADQICSVFWLKLLCVQTGMLSTETLMRSSSSTFFNQNPHGLVLQHRCLVILHVSDFLPADFCRDNSDPAVQ